MQRGEKVLAIIPVDIDGFIHSDECTVAQNTSAVVIGEIREVGPLRSQVSPPRGANEMDLVLATVSDIITRCGSG